MKNPHSSPVVPVRTVKVASFFSSFGKKTPLPLPSASSAFFLLVGEGRASPFPSPIIHGVIFPSLRNSRQKRPPVFPPFLDAEDLHFP